MHYKITVKENISEEQLAEMFSYLRGVIKKNKNMRIEEESTFIQKEKALYIFNASWGIKRPEIYDIEDLSLQYPSYTFYFMEATDILNRVQLDTASNYSLSEYSKGTLQKIYTPKPVEWVMVQDFS